MKHEQDRKHGVSRIAGVVLAGLVSVAASGVRGEEKAPPADAYAPIDIRQIKVGGELGRRMDITVSNNLLKIDIDKDFLAPFAAKNARGNDVYIGLGKTLDGMVQLAATTGSDALTARKKHVVDELVKLQQPDGYIGIMLPEQRTWRLWDLHEQSYIIYALIDDSRLFGEERSLATARKLADYILSRWPTKPADWAKSLSGTEWLFTTGLKRAFLTLHEATGDRRYLDFVVRDLQSKEWDPPLVLGRHGMIEGHSYSYFSHCLVQLDLYRLDPQAMLLGPTQRAMDFLLAKDGMAITGGAGHDECWSDEQRGTGNLGETCSTLYQTLVYDSLLRMKGESRWGDLLERTLYNAAFGAQSPDGRKLRYYVPFEGPRVYFDRDTYCCPGNYRRLVGTVPSLVYYRAGNGVAVNLYTPSRATVEGVGGTAVVLSQETDYPNSGKVTLRVEPQRSAKFPLLLRIPGWCAKASVAVNGTPNASPAKSGEFMKIDRTWQSGDKVTLDMAMPWRFVAGRKTQAGRAAVMRGPLVYTLSPTRIALTLTAPPATKETPVGIDVLANYPEWPVEQNCTRGKPMKIGAKEYARGLFCHAVSKMIVRLPGAGKSFSAIVGVDANNDPGVKGSVVFSVSVAGKQAYASPVLQGKAEGVPVAVNLGGAREFTLEASDGGDGIAYDWSCWAEAQVTLNDGTSVDLGKMPLRDLRPKPLVANVTPTPDPRRLVLLPETVEFVADDASVRPGGTACRIKADLDKADKGAFTLTLTEFPDPDAQATYFLLPDLKAAVSDEWMRRESK